MSMRVIDLDNKPEQSTERRPVVNTNNINNVGNVELAKKIQAMTDEEKRVVARNLPVNVMLDAIQDEFLRYHELENKLDDMLKRFGK